MKSGERFLADENFPLPVSAWLGQQGYDVLTVGQHYAGWKDIELLKLAQEEDRIFLTFDSDFGDLVFRRRFQANVGVVLFRMKNLTSAARRIVVTAFFETNPEVP